jgi:hypothetical protein
MLRVLSVLRVLRVSHFEHLEHPEHLEHLPYRNVIPRMIGTYVARSPGVPTLM